MVGWDAPLATDMTYANDVNGPISVIARETAKPGRDLPGDGWVIQANADWTRQHLEWDRAEVVPPILDAFFGALGCTLVAPAISMGHRWRYALASKPLGQPYLTDVALGLSVCGDWCLGPTALDAFSSGRRLATALLSD